ncbi:hypothetical protein [Rhodoferax sp. UBA5149]|uniref:hypothetical protein n=1 Tax=Rhodoferax sp. UBA5149 TaxID=1947379 RepID=UPI0025CECDFC|nr:hypothetical protein [Rhodoferax sp. UBA5149]
MATLKTRLDARLLALESATQPRSPYAVPLMPGCTRLPLLVLRGPDELAELAHARARGFVAELETPENNARFLG